MQDEEFDDMDNLIKKASESYHAVYSDTAWEKMEALLDKHLPQKPRRRKPFVFWLLLLLTGGVVTLVILFPRDKKQNETVAKANGKQTVKLLQQKLPKTGSGKSTLVTNNTSANQTSGVPEILADNSNGNSFAKNLLRRKRLSVSKRGITKTSGNNAQNNDAAFDESSKNIAEVFEDAPATAVMSIKVPLPQVHLIQSDLKSAHLNTPIVKNDSASVTETATTSDKPATLAKQQVVAKQAATKQQTKKGFANSFAITISAGPELSFIRLSDPGKTKIIYGAGVSYPVGKKIMLRSGFYVAKKIYSAKAGDYNPPSYYWTNNANVLKIDADCKVYEIPLSASYNFKQGKNYNWMAGAGLSTFIMNREIYKYHFKNLQGQYMVRSWTVPVTNRKTHYFSVLTISGGYQYRFNRNISIIAEPYFKIPLQGVGFGKINLSSGGLLMSASIKPFANKK